MNCGRRISIAVVEELIDRILNDRIMPEIMTYQARTMIEFKERIEREYFASTIKFKGDHISIRVNDSINLEQMRTVKLKNEDYSVILSTRNIEIIPKHTSRLVRSEGSEDIALDDFN